MKYKIHLKLVHESYGTCFQSEPGKFLGIVGQDPSDFKSSRLYVDIFRFCFIIGSISYRFLLNNRQVYEVSNFNRLFPELD